ncbi:MAG: YggS family pyridoxal phosphate-dependent enzyme [Ruminiclostridium sp.]|nr:YggS family pyridoxal phosphate-dependent enzyme [Ruminiclostridium sp.]
MKEGSSDNSGFSVVADNIRRINENIENAKLRAGRTDTVRLMGVTKTVAPEIVSFSVKQGVTLLGENRVQEFLDKRDRYEGSPEVHFIGGLQTNKVKYIIDKVSMIHSADSEHLIAEIDRRAAGKGLTMDILIEVNIGGEESKSGIRPEELDELAYRTAGMHNVRLRGLMAIPPVDVDGSSDRYFAMMQKLFSDLRSKTAGDGRFLVDTLSMGMSGDYESAIMHGSNIVRIGSLLYGYRNYTK